MQASLNNEGDFKNIIRILVQSKQEDSSSLGRMESKAEKPRGIRLGSPGTREHP